MNAKVLLVDDDAEFAKLIEYNLKRQSCEVLVASSAVQGLYLARTTLPDIILLDLMLPDLDGFSVCHILQVQPSTKHIPVFIVSALDAPSFGSRGSKARFAKYFQKPVDIKLLSENVRTTSEEHQAWLRSTMSETSR
jgi:DNA-binding response OmpR family regulator